MIFKNLLTNSGPITILHRCFAIAARAMKKGGVEGLVGYARRNYMVPVPEADTLEQLNERLFGGMCILTEITGSQAES